MQTSSAPARLRREIFRFAGCNWVLETTSHELCESVGSALPMTDVSAEPEFFLKLEVGRHNARLWPGPLFRGRDHLVVAAYGPDDVMVVDLEEHSVTGTVSPIVAADHALWQRLFIPVIVGVASAAVGIAPLHCATLVKNGRGLHLSGVSGAGKSTLTAALATRGFSVLSDDWTYFSARGESLIANGLPVPLKLLADATNFFPQLANVAPAPSLNGELAFEFDPVKTLGSTRVHSCVPERLVFLQRTANLAWQVRRVAPEEVMRQFRPALERLPQFLGAERRRQLDIIRLFSQVPAYAIRCNGLPREIADRILDWMESGFAVTDAELCRHLPVQFEVPDVMRRFVPTPFSVPLSVGAGFTRMLTNNKAIASAPHLLSGSLPPELRQHEWTVVEDSAVWPEMNWQSGRFSVHGRRDVGLRVSDHARRRSFVYLAPTAAAKLSELVASVG